VLDPRVVLGRVGQVAQQDPGWGLYHGSVTIAFRGQARALRIGEAAPGRPTARMVGRQPSGFAQKTIRSTKTTAATKANGFCEGTALPRL
jgi:hypothetical protein